MINYEKHQALTDNLTVDQPIANRELTTKKEREESKNKTTTATTAREAQLQRLSHFFEGNNFGRMAHCIMDDFTAYLDEGADALLVERCMKEAVDCGTPTWAYARKVLERCRVQNIETVEQFETEKAAKNNKRKQEGSHDRTRVREDPPPLPGVVRL